MIKCEYLILGGGIAGWTAAETLRAALPEAEIILVNEEKHPLYSRVLLPLYVKGKIPREKVFLRPPDYLAKNNIKSFAGARAIGVNPASKTAALNNGGEINYQKLLIATGGAPAAVEEKNLPGAHFFRTLDDADGIVSGLGSLRAGAPCAALGSSFIALEFPSIFEKFGMKTLLAMRGPGFFHRLLDRDSMDLIEAEIIRHGGQVLKNQKDFETVEADFFGLGLGMEKNTDFARAAGIGAETGILTNEYLETNIPDIWAAGDVAEFYDVIAGKHRISGNWMNAEAQGRMAAANMMGEHLRFETVSSYSMPVFNLAITFVGDVAADESTKIIIRCSREAKSLVRILIKDNLARGATLLGRNLDRGPLTALIGRRAPLAVRPELSDPDFDLKQLL
ncbi:FAD-dependent oxidoreductase [Candidatus Uhrbacteria bacterium]|nr:FAD-dependent oxidoreductase [Candidatus Uhrbacteria bacterium]